MSPSSSPKRARYYTGIRLSPWIALALTACGPVLIGLGAGGAGGGGGGGTSPDATVPVADQVRLRVEPATNRVVHLDVLPPKTGGTLSCKVVDSTSGLISVDALDAASGSRVVRFEKDIISTLVVPIPERFLGGTSQLRVTATYDGNFYKTGVETKKSAARSNRGGQARH